MPEEEVVVEPILKEENMNNKEEVLASMKEIGDPINALKANIQQLEELLRKKEQDIIEREESLKAAKKAESKTVLITGASAGIGKATAEVFAENGYRLILTGRRNKKLEEIKSHLVDNFEVDVETLSFDVTDAESCQKAIKKLPDEWRNIDILVNNAGKAKGKDPIHQGRLDHWEEMIDTNIKGLLYMSRAVSPIMVEREAGHIINVCSLAGKEVYPNGNVYCATKHAVDALTKGMQLDLHQYNVRVSQVSPAMVEETEFAKVRYDGDEEKAQIYDGFQPLKAKDVGATIHFIATQPAHVNIQDVVMMGVQQPNSVTVDRSGRDKF
jgi:NADP-dependent 3-hydroxy acid dehydrogenase YdfG